MAYKHSSEDAIVIHWVSGTQPKEVKQYPRARQFLDTAEEGGLSSSLDVAAS